MNGSYAGDILLILRTVRGLRREELAQLARVDATAISDYERGLTPLSLPVLLQLVSALGYPLASIEDAHAFLLAIQQQKATCHRPRGAGS